MSEIGHPPAVVTLVDPAAGVTLRAPEVGDRDAIVEQCRDPEMAAWTTVPQPYAPSHVDDFLEVVAAGWAVGTPLIWAIEAERDGRLQYCGSIDLRISDGQGTVGYGLHPGARGRSLMSSALRLVRDHGLDTLGLESLRWRARVGNWPSRRVADAAGFVFDGTVRRLLVERGTWHDGWSATLTADDPRTPRRWLEPTSLGDADGIRLRPFRADDAARIVEACSDPRTRHWLVSLPHPYERADAEHYLASVAEQSARRTGMAWCVTDATDRCLGAISLEGLGGYDQRGEIGYWAHPHARGRGAITRAVRLVTDWAETTGTTSAIVIRCAASNAASRHVAEAVGYREVGVLRRAEPVGDGSLVDLVLYARP